MSHPPRRVRHDAYGVPLPVLDMAQRQSLVQSEHNQAMRKYLLHLLEQDYADLFRRGMYAELTLILRIDNGSMQADVDVGIQRHHRYESGA